VARHRAQIAIMPKNRASDASAAASSTTALIIELSYWMGTRCERNANIVPFLFSSQPGPGTLGKILNRGAAPERCHTVQMPSGIVRIALTRRQGGLA
jgi:hypothetical protein